MIDIKVSKDLFFSLLYVVGVSFIKNIDQFVVLLFFCLLWCSAN